MSICQLAMIYFTDGEAPLLHCKGDWTIAKLGQLPEQMSRLVMPAAHQIQVDGAEITRMDSAGAWLLFQYIQLAQSRGKEINVSGLAEEYQSLLKLISKQKINHIPVLPKPSLNPLQFIGEETAQKLKQMLSFLNFVGLTVVTTTRLVSKSVHFHWQNWLHQIEEIGFRALPIIALLSFLIGVVLAYQIGLQLTEYGADVFIVDLSGIAIFREFGPLITAIIAAGRTSSAITAEIGTMKVHEEIDALRTMGLSPISRLVLPKILGALVAMPLLTLWSDVFGIFGSMVMSKAMVNMSFHDFLSRLQMQVDIKHFWVGMIKAPVYATIISAVGCFQGFQVGSSADSVGRQTTKSVVQAIFLIIIADALFSIFFSWINI